MNPYRIPDLLAVIGMVLGITLLLAYVGPSLDDHSDEHRTAQSLLDAQQDAQRQFRMELATAKLCRETHGESLVRYTADGQAVCIPRGHIRK